VSADEHLGEQFQPKITDWRQEEPMWGKDSPEWADRRLGPNGWDPKSHEVSVARKGPGEFHMIGRYQGPDGTAKEIRYTPPPFKTMTAAKKHGMEFLTGKLGWK
jgi:hypothetical protein